MRLAKVHVHSLHAGLAQIVLDWSIVMICRAKVGNAASGAAARGCTRVFDLSAGSRPARRRETDRFLQIDFFHPSPIAKDRIVYRLDTTPTWVLVETLGLRPVFPPT